MLYHLNSLNQGRLTSHKALKFCIEEAVQSHWITSNQVILKSFPRSQAQASALPTCVLEGDLSVHLSPTLIFQQHLLLSVLMPSMMSPESHRYLELNFNKRIFVTAGWGKGFGVLKCEEHPKAKGFCQIRAH